MLIACEKILMQLIFSLKGQTVHDSYTHRFVYTIKHPLLGVRLWKVTAWLYPLPGTKHGHFLPRQ